jgi:hypothetical protein
MMDGVTREAWGKREKKKKIWELGLRRQKARRMSQQRKWDDYCRVFFFFLADHT